MADSSASRKPASQTPASAVTTPPAQPVAPAPPQTPPPTTAGAARPIEWWDAVEKIKPYVVKIVTPGGYGTGFLFTYAGDPNICGIATAAHVIRDAHNWEQPIRIEHFASGKSIVVHPDERGVQLNEKLDTAAIVVHKRDIPFPGAILPLTPTGKWVKAGVEWGWVGFPVLASNELCFFSGRVSTWLPKRRAYLVDGVAIHGVSGGPAFILAGQTIHINGVVSEYHPHRLPGETWPGFCVVTDVQQFQDIVKTFRSIEEAKRQESPPSEAPVPSSHQEPPLTDAKPGEEGEPPAESPPS